MKTKLKSKDISSKENTENALKNTIEANIKYIYDSFDNENKIKAKRKNI